MNQTLDPTAALATSCLINRGITLSSLEHARVLLKDAFRERRLVSYTRGRSNSQASIGCAGNIICWATGDHSFFFALAFVNDASLHDADGTITDFSTIEATLDEAYRLLTEGT